MDKILYVGAKCVPSFYAGPGDSHDWIQGVTYEALTVVRYNGSLFISKVPVPSTEGAPAEGAYWAAVPGYLTDVPEQTLLDMLADITQLQEDTTSLESDLSEYESIFTGNVDESVDNWLDAHPEATTTVQDGAITEAKLHDGAVTDSKTADEYRNLYYDEVTVETGRTSNTDYYLATVPEFDSDGELIPLSLSYSNTLNPLEQAWEKGSTITINGYGTANANGVSRNGIGICDGVLTTNFSFENIAPDNYLYIGVKADRTIIEYKMNSAVTAQEMISDGCLNVFNSYFKLVENGEIVSGLSEGTIILGSEVVTETMRNPLMLMGIKSNGDIIFMACDGRTIINDGLTYREAGEILISQGCVTVYNLDGGGSACLVVKGSKLNRNIDDNGTAVRNVRYALNVIKPSVNVPTKGAYKKIGTEKQKTIEQIIPYINGVYDSILSKIGKVIRAGTDLNDVVSDGKYFCSASSVAQQLTNCPVRVGFSMYVLKQGGTGRAYTQIIIANPTSNKQLIYYRFVMLTSAGALEQASPWYVITSTAVE